MNLDKLSPVLRELYDTYAEHGGLSDRQIAELTGRPGGSVSPGRLRLQKLGLVEQVDTRTSAFGKPEATFGIVPPERVDEVRNQTARRRPRLKRIEHYSVEARKMMVRALLREDAVNEAVMEEQGRSWRRARGRAQEETAARERERRERKRDVEEAEKEGSYLTDFLKVKRNLKDSTEVVRKTLDFVNEDTSSRNEIGMPLIPVAFWPEVLGYLQDHLTMTKSTFDALNKMLYGDPEIADAEVVDGEVLELLEWFEGEPVDPDDEDPDG